MYEYQCSQQGSGIYGYGYLNNGLKWWTLTPINQNTIRIIDNNKESSTSTNISSLSGIRPVINLKPDIKIVSGDGTVNNPYRLDGDNDTNLSGTPLNLRYSGEYISFGIGENNLYRIVSHEVENLTKIASAEPLKSSGNFVNSAFDSEIQELYSDKRTIGVFLNQDYLNNEVYLASNEVEMIEENNTWYLGKIGSGTSYKLAKYTDTNMSGTTSYTTNAKVGLLRVGELMTGQFNNRNNGSYWTLTPNGFNVNYMGINGGIGSNTPRSKLYGVRPVIFIKSNVVITGGDGTKNNPFTLSE